MSNVPSRLDPGSAVLIVIMGASGCGKTSVGRGIAAGLAADFIEGDALHPRRNLEKMSAGVPLNDADRGPWLDRIGGELQKARAARRRVVVSCSALKRTYRDRLRQTVEDRLYFVFLRGSRDTLLERMMERRGHYMPPSLLDSQLATLEDPCDEPNVLSFDIDNASIEKIINDTRQKLEGLGII